MFLELATCKRHDQKKNLFLKMEFFGGMYFIQLSFICFTIWRQNGCECRALNLPLSIFAVKQLFA